MKSIRRVLTGVTLSALVSTTALAQASYNPPSRPYASNFDGYTAMHFPHNSPLINVPQYSHWILFEIALKLNRYQPHEGYTNLLQNSIPGTTWHTVNITIGGVDVHRHYSHLPPDYDTFGWDGTWMEYCGPTGNALVDGNGQPIPPEQYPPCASYIEIELSPDGDPEHTFRLNSPFTVKYDDEWHIYQIFVDTFYNGNSNSYKAQIAIDNTLLTDPWDCSSIDYQFHALTDCAGTFQGGFYFTVDGMDWDMFFDNADFGPYADTTIPNHDVTQLLTAMNFSGSGPDLSDLIAAEALAWQSTPWGPYYLTEPVYVGQRAFGYVPEINNWGDEWSFALGTAPVAWMAIGYTSSEDWNPGYTGGTVYRAVSDAW